MFSSALRRCILEDAKTTLVVSVDSQCLNISRRRKLSVCYDTSDSCGLMFMLRKEAKRLPEPIFHLTVKGTVGGLIGSTTAKDSGPYRFTINPRLGEDTNRNLDPIFLRILCAIDHLINGVLPRGLVVRPLRPPSLVWARLSRTAAIVVGCPLVAESRDPKRAW